MPSSDVFARVGLLAAVSVVVGISTLGTLTKPPPPDTRLITIAPRPPEPPTAPLEAIPAASQPQGAAASTPTEPVIMASPVNATLPRAEDKAAGPPVGGPFVPVANAPAPREPANSAVSAVSAAPPAAFPDIQPLDETGIVAATPAAEPAPPVAAAKPKKRIAAAPKHKRVAKPAPYEIREFFAGHW